MAGLKPIHWMGDSLDRLRRLPEDVRSDVGYQLELVQGGENPDDFRPMPDVGPGAVEIRIHGVNEYRVFFVARFAEAVYVLHGFEKKTQATRQADIELAGIPRGKTNMRSDASMRAKLETLKSETLTRGSGNVFSDLGFAPAVARNLRMRSQMMLALRKFIEREGLTQATAAKRLKVTQPRISDLTRGKISRFSLDTLVNMLTDAGLEVDLRVRTGGRRVA